MDYRLDQLPSAIQDLIACRTLTRLREEQTELGRHAAIAAVLTAVDFTEKEIAEVFERDAAQVTRAMRHLREVLESETSRWFIGRGLYNFWRTIARQVLRETSASARFSALEGRKG